MKKILRKIRAFILLEIIYAPKRLYTWIRGGSFSSRVRDSDGEILWQVGNASDFDEFDNMFELL